MSDHDTFSSGCNNLTEAELESIGVDPQHRAVDVPLAWAAAEQRARQLEADLLACTRARDEAQQEVADRDEVLADMRRLTRLLDVALFGEEGAAQQASLCDLIGPAQNMRAHLADAREQLEVLKPGGSYAWKSKYVALHAALTQRVAQWREQARQQGAIYASGLVACADDLAALLVFPSDRP